MEDLSQTKLKVYLVETVEIRADRNFGERHPRKRLFLAPTSPLLLLPLEAQTELDQAGVKMLKRRDFGPTAPLTLDEPNSLNGLCDQRRMSGIYAKYFSQPFPARTTIAAAVLPLGARVEIDLVVKA